MRPVLRAASGALTRRLRRDPIPADPGAENDNRHSVLADPGSACAARSLACAIRSGSTIGRPLLERGGDPLVHDLGERVEQLGMELAASRADRVQQRGQSLPQRTDILRPKARTEEAVDEDRNPFGRRRCT